MTWARRALWIFGGLLALIGAAPVASVAIAGTLANRHGCTLHEGFPNPCIINGVDRGETLYAMAVAGWFMLVSLPLLALGLILLLIAAIWTLIARRRG